MHREYHPEDLHHHLHDHARTGPNASASSHQHDDHRPLFALTTVLGILIALDLVLGALGRTDLSRPFGISLSLIAAVLGGLRIVYLALEGLLAGRIGADLALAQACIAAIVLGDPFVAAEVVFIALVGEALEAFTADRALRAIGRVFEAEPRSARVRRDGVAREIPIDQVVPGDRVLVSAGEKIPVDGTIRAGRTSVDQAALTGEPLPIDRGPGEVVFAGTINQFSDIEVETERVGRETTLGQVLRLVSEAQRKKAPLQRAADRYARWFLPVVELAAGLTLLAGWLLGWPDTGRRAVAVLVVACPCALVLATPAAVMAAMAWLARHGILIKGGIALERLAGCDTLAFDKTGTLTVGRPQLVEITPLRPGWNSQDLLRLALSVESTSRHPLAEAIRSAATDRGLTPFEVADVVAHPGAGMTARWREWPDAPIRSVLLGNPRLLEEQSIPLTPELTEALERLDARGETALIVAVDGEGIGFLSAQDRVRPEAHDVVHDLKHLGFREIAILTGDREAAARAVAKRVHLKEISANLTPAQKAAWIRERQESGRRVVMVGDGINDAPALATAQVGIAIGAAGCDLAAEAGEIVLLGEPLRSLPDLVRLARKTVAILRQNILLFAFGLNAAAILAAFLGVLGPVAAALLHQAGSLLVLLNAMRLLVFGDWQQLAPIRWARAGLQAIRRLDDQVDPGLIFRRALARWRWFAALAGLVLILGYASWNLVAIGPGETGLVQRFGRFVATLEAGPHWRWPPPWERITRLRPAALRTVEVGFRSGRPDPSSSTVRWESRHDRQVFARSEDESLALTGDGQLIEVTVVLQYRLNPSPESLRRFAFGLADAEEAIRALTESAVHAVLGRHAFEAILTTDRRQVEHEVAALVQERVAAALGGIQVVSLDFQDVHPPLPVVDAFRDVTRAMAEQQARINQGRSYQIEQAITAKGVAQVIENAAEAERTGRRIRAKGQAEAFLDRLKARRSAPELTDLRLYHEQVSEALGGKPKLLMDPGPAPAARRHLILPAGSPASGLTPAPVLVAPLPSESDAAPADSREMP